MPNSTGFRQYSGTRAARSLNKSNTFIVMGTAAEFKKSLPQVEAPSDLAEESYWIKTLPLEGKQTIVIVGGDERGILYGSFELIRHLSHGHLSHDGDVQKLEFRGGPAMPIRWTNEWDNADGTVERGYGGRSIFFEGRKVREDLWPVTRVRAAAGVGRDQWLQCEQREQCGAVSGAGDAEGAGADCGHHAAVGRAAGDER